MLLVVTHPEAGAGRMLVGSNLIKPMKLRHRTNHTAASATLVQRIGHFKPGCRPAHHNNATATAAKIGTAAINGSSSALKLLPSASMIDMWNSTGAGLDR